MESNLFIKNYATRGNKVTAISFYGDWEIGGIGGSSGDVIRKGIKKSLPSDIEVSLYQDAYVKIKNAGDSTPYMIDVLYSSEFGITGRLESRKFNGATINVGRSFAGQIPNDTKGYGERFLYIIIRKQTLENYDIVGYLKAGFRNGQFFVEGAD